MSSHQTGDLVVLKTLNCNAARKPVYSPVECSIRSFQVLHWSDRTGQNRSGARCPRADRWVRIRIVVPPETVSASVFFARLSTNVHSQGDANQVEKRIRPEGAIWRKAARKASWSRYRPRRYCPPFSNTRNKRAGYVDGRCVRKRQRRRWETANGLCLGSSSWNHVSRRVTVPVRDASGVWDATHGSLAFATVL